MVMAELKSDDGNFGNFLEQHALSVVLYGLLRSRWEELQSVFEQRCVAFLVGLRRRNDWRRHFFVDNWVVVAWPDSRVRVPFVYN